MPHPLASRSYGRLIVSECSLTNPRDQRKEFVRFNGLMLLTRFSSAFARFLATRIEIRDASAEPHPGIPPKAIAPFIFARLFASILIEYSDRRESIMNPMKFQSLMEIEAIEIRQRLRYSTVLG
jgi:hypothetical protein